MDVSTELNWLIQLLEDRKAKDLVVTVEAPKSAICDAMIVVTGTSSRHVKSMAEYLEEEIKKQRSGPVKMEGLESGEWVLVDTGSVIVHLMQKETREYYQLESLWGMVPRD